MLLIEVRCKNEKDEESVRATIKGFLADNKYIIGFNTKVSNNVRFSDVKIGEYFVSVKSPEAIFQKIKDGYIMVGYKDKNYEFMVHEFIKYECNGTHSYKVIEKPHWIN